MSRPTILILIGAFWPGNDSSGPNLSIRALCEGLADSFDFRIVARDRPFGAGAPVVDNSRWHDLGFAKIHYLPVGRAGAIGLSQLLHATPHSLLVLNGFFDREFTLPALVARRLGRIGGAPVMLSPRGEFTGGALALKSTAKSIFRHSAALTGLHRGVHFHATSDGEIGDIRAAMRGYPVTLVPNFRPLFPLPSHQCRIEGEPLRLAFLGRISPVKGLDIALRALAAADVPAMFDIYGPIADAGHWALCEDLIAATPGQVTVVYHGEIANDVAAAMLAAHDALLLPSLSENFGHAIFESLASGTPVLIGDQTPWRGLAEAKAGFDCPVGDVTALAGAIRVLAHMPASEMMHWRDGARSFADRYSQRNDAGIEMANLFNRLIGDAAA